MPCQLPKSEGKAFLAPSGDQLQNRSFLVCLLHYNRWDLYGQTALYLISRGGTSTIYQGLRWWCFGFTIFRIGEIEEQRPYLQTMLITGSLKCRTLREIKENSKLTDLTRHVSGLCCAKIGYAELTIVALF